MRIKIVGAGSAGMHHAHAARQLDWTVTITDNDPRAIERLPSAYARRYGEWDTQITTEGRGSYDLIIVATPPATHYQVLLAELNNGKRFLVEKPLCAPGQAFILPFKHPPIFVGYGHVLQAEPLRPLNNLYICWVEHWHYILTAHPWLTGPHDSYLGDWTRGGGALCEHSHGLNLFQHLAREGGHGEIVSVRAQIDYVDGYDRTALLELETENGFIGYVEQNVIADPRIKRASTGQTFNGMDFKIELEHVTSADPLTSPLSLDKALRTMSTINAAHQSAKEGCPVEITDFHFGSGE